MAFKKKVSRQSRGATVSIATLLADIRGLILAARRAVIRSVDILQVVTSFEIGRRIVEQEQQGDTQGGIRQIRRGGTGQASDYRIWQGVFQEQSRIYE